MKRMTVVLAGAYLLLAAGWLLSYLAPVAWEVAQAAAFFLGVVVAALLWWAARRRRSERLFWRLLAAGWTVGLAIGVAWGVYELATGHTLPGGSWFGSCISSAMAWSWPHLAAVSRRGRAGGGPAWPLSACWPWP